MTSDFLPLLRPHRGGGFGLTRRAFNPVERRSVRSEVSLARWVWGTELAMRTAFSPRAAHRRRALAGVLLAGLAASAGCSFVDSSVSPSQSVSASSASSAGDRDEDYRRDVRDYTARHVRSGGGYDAFERSLDDIARRHGISDWENDPNTWVGVGQGLREAGVTGDTLDSYKTSLTSSDPGRMREIQP